MSGFKRSNLVRSFRPNRSSAGARPVDLWGVLRYEIRNLCKANSVSTLAVLAEAYLSLKVLTALSAKPLVFG